MLSVSERKALVSWLVRIRRRYGLTMATLGTRFNGSGDMNWEEKRQLTWKRFLEVAPGTMRVWALYSGRVHRPKGVPSDLVPGKRHGTYTRVVALESMPTGLWQSIEEDWKFCYPRTCWRGTYRPEQLMIIEPGDCPAAALMVIKLLPKRMEERLEMWETYLQSRFVRFLFGVWWATKSYKKVRNIDWAHVPYPFGEGREADQEVFLKMPDELLAIMDRSLADWEGETEMERQMVRVENKKKWKVKPPTMWHSQRVTSVNDPTRPR